MAKRFFFSVGEPSGDVHAAGLAEALRRYHPEVDLVGYGGPKMEAAGVRLLADPTRHAVMWLNALGKILYFRRLRRAADRYFTENPVDAVVLVDYPGFNWHIARTARNHGIPVYYFMPPQIWAWAQWRAGKMRALIDHTLTPLRFEQCWFVDHGIRSTFIGHPFFQECRERKADPGFLEPFFTQMSGGPVLTILPGSRTQEIQANLLDMLEAVLRVHEQVPNVRPVVAAFNRKHADLIAGHLADSERYSGLSIPVYVDRTPDLIRAADCCLAVSGSVSLELLACNVPTVIYYRVGKLGFLLQRLFRRSRYITLVNLIAVSQYGSEAAPGQMGCAGQRYPFLYPDSQTITPAVPTEKDRSQMLFPEILTSRNRSAEAAAQLIDWLRNPASLAQRKRELAVLLAAADDVEQPLDVAAGILLNGT